MWLADASSPLPPAVSSVDSSLNWDLLPLVAQILHWLIKIKTSCSSIQVVHPQLWYSTCPASLPLPPSYLFLIVPFSFQSFCCSLYLLFLLLLPLFSRAVMGLDSESDVVHIETRIAEGRECCTLQSTTVARPTGPFASHLERGQGEDETRSARQIGPWSLVKQNGCLLTKMHTFAGLMDVSSSKSFPCVSYTNLHSPTSKQHGIFCQPITGFPCICKDTHIAHVVRKSELACKLLWSQTKPSWTVSAVWHSAGASAELA